MVHQIPPFDPGPQAVREVQRTLQDDIRSSKDPRKRRKDSGPGHRFNILKRIARKLQGK